MLPTCPERQAGETMPEYAARVLRFLLAENITATLSDEQLEQADCAAQRAAAQMRGEDGRASRLDLAQLTTLQTLTDTRHTIAAVLRWRAEQHRAAVQDDRGEAHPPQGGTSPGRPARLTTPPPTLPPAPAYAKPQTLPPVTKRF